MFYFTLITISIIIIIILIIALQSYSEYRKKSKLEKNSSQENHIYQKEKFNKIKDRYYRGIEIEEKNQTLEQNYNIVGFDQPKGKWTKMILMQNLKYMTTLKHLMGNNLSKLGIWQLKVKAQSLISHGIHKGKGR
jgi:hypothetical protein